MQARVPVVYRDQAGQKKPASKKKRKRRPAKGAASKNKPDQALPPRFQGTPVPLKIRITRIRPRDVVPGIPDEFHGTSNVNCDLVITVAGKRVPGLSLDEFATRGEVSLNEWLKLLNGLRYQLYMERRFVCRATGNQLGLVFERKGKIVAFSVHDTYRKAAVPGFEHLILDRAALVRELHDFVAKARRLVLRAAPDHAAADNYWGWHVHTPIDEVDDVDDDWRGRD